MEALKECPVCGSTEIRQGQMGDTRMFPKKPMVSTLLNGGSNIIAIICSDCGRILSMNVEKPQKFK